MRDKIKDKLLESIQIKEELMRTCIVQIIEISEAVVRCLKKGGKVILFGNGGSAADSQHLAAEFVGRFKKDRKALAAIALTTDTSILTSLANDYGYEVIFAKQIEALGNKNDVVIGISTSGRAKNVLRGIRQAKQMGITTSLDTGWPHEGESIHDTDPVWPHLDVFLPNEAEAMLLSETQTVEDALESFAARLPTVVLKLGPDGAVARSGGETIRRASFQIEVVDTTGAGDSFNGGFLHGWLSGMDLAGALDLGLACGALSIRAPGGTTSQATLAEATEFIRTAPRRFPD